MIEAIALGKSFRVHEKVPGLKGSLKGLFKRKYVEKQALVDASFSVAPGEIVGLVGANGAGKTTLVKLLSGIMYPSSGTARVLGYTPWERQNEFRRQIALIMGQKAQLWWDLPAADCFLLLREIYQIPPAQFHEMLEFLIDTLEVRKQLKIQIRRLSLGERMKMELIAALLHRPKVVYLDEPTIGLDISAQRSIRRFILDYSAQHRPAMILTSHYMEDIQQLCKRILIIREGRFVYDGPIERVSNEFAKYKVVRTKLVGECGEGELQRIKMLRGVEDASIEEGLLVARVKREMIAEAASQMLKELPILDLTIEEEDISTVIEAIMRSGSQGVRA